MRIAFLAVRLLLAITFAAAGIAKLFDLPGSRKSLEDFGVPVSLVFPLAFLLPAAELVGAVALIPDATASWGAWGVSALLVLFIAGISINLARGKNPDCHCFGQLKSEPVGPKTLARNFFLLAAACLIVWRGRAYPAAGIIEQYSSFDIALVIATGLLGAAVALALRLLFQMLQQNGRLLLRLETIEKKLSIDPDATPVRGLAVGTPAPHHAFDVLSDTSLLLVFTEPGCGPCEALQPELAQWRSEYGERLTINSISNPETSQAFQVSGTPSAVLIVDGFIASSLAEGTEAIRALVQQATLPTVIKKGDPLPALQLPDLDGRAVDLTAQNGLRTLLLFWSPSCGYCQDMLDDVKKWERNRPPGAPELLVISSGSAEESREQGFRATVLLDQNGVGNRLGIDGTPSALIINEQGIVVSKVGVGASEVLALAASSASPAP